MARHRILYMNDSGHIGGAEKILVNVAKVIEQDKYELEFLFGSGGAIYDSVRAMGYQTYLIPLPHLISWQRNKLLVPLNFFRFLRSFLRLVGFLKDYKCDAVVTNSIRFEIVGSLAAKVTGHKLFWHTHNIQPAGIRRKIIGWLASHFPNKIIAVSDAVKNSYRDTRAYPNIRVVHNGINCAAPEIEGEKNSENFTVLMLSVLTSWKGHTVLLDALKILKARGEGAGVVALIAGAAPRPADGMYREKLVRRAQSMFDSDEVQFLGEVENIQPLLDRASVLASLSSRPDPFPTVLLEALSHGVPCIATNTGGQAEIVEHDRNGLLIEPDNAELLADAILFCEQHPETLERFSAQCKRDFQEKYTLHKFQQRYTNALESFISSS